MIKKVLLKICDVLNKEKIPYMVIGGQAVLFYGFVRFTEDIDITLGLGIEERSKIINLFDKMNLKKPKNVNDDFIKKTFCLIGIEKDTGIRVDFVFSYTPYEREAIERVKVKEVDKVRVKFASIEDLIIHKLFAGRERDYEDVRKIMEKNIKKIKIDYIRKKLKLFSSLNGCQKMTEEFNRILKKLKKKE